METEPCRPRSRFWAGCPRGEAGYWSPPGSIAPATSTCNVVPKARGGCRGDERRVVAYAPRTRRQAREPHAREAGPATRLAELAGSA